MPSALGFVTETTKETDTKTGGSDFDLLSYFWNSNLKKNATRRPMTKQYGITVQTNVNALTKLTDYQISHNNVQRQATKAASP